MVTWNEYELVWRTSTVCFTNESKREIFVPGLMNESKSEKSSVKEPAVTLLTSILITARQDCMGGIALMASFWMILPYSVYKRSPTFKDVFTMRFFDKYIKLENDKGSIEWDWNLFSTFIESPHFFHLYFNSKSFFLVPKAAVEKDGDVNELRTMLQQKILKH